MRALRGFGIALGTALGVAALGGTLLAASQPILVGAGFNGGTVPSDITMSGSQICVNTDGASGGNECIRVDGNAWALTVNGATKMYLDANALQNVTANSWYLELAASSATNPTLIPDSGSLTAGIGGTGGDVSIITAGVERLNFNTSGWITVPSTGLVLLNSKLRYEPAGIESFAGSTRTLGVGATTFAVFTNIHTVDCDAGGNTIGTITGAPSGEYALFTFKFIDSNCTITDTSAETANTVNLEAAFTSTAADTLHLLWDGNKFYEVDRGVN
jgi:hypothetical protein